MAPHAVKTNNSTGKLEVSPKQTLDSSAKKKHQLWYCEMAQCYLVKWISKKGPPKKSPKPAAPVDGPSETRGSVVDPFASEGSSGD